MNPASARLLDEVATEASRTHAAAILQLAALERFQHTRQHRAILERERDHAARVIEALRAARIRSFFLGAAEQPFEGLA